jgi:hypothetical protein
VLGAEPSTFGRAWRRGAYRRFAAQLGLGDQLHELLPLDDVIRRLHLVEQTYVGVRTIRVAAIVGTVDRGGDFDGRFLPRRAEMAERWNRVERLVRAGSAPPIEVYEVDGRYFVSDGHHRVAIARQREMDHIEAEITRLRTRVPLLKSEPARPEPERRLSA